MGARDDRVSGDRLSSRRSGVPSSVMSTGIRPVRRIPGDVPPRVRWRSGFRVPYFGCRGADFTDEVRSRLARRGPDDGRLTVGAEPTLPKTSGCNSLVADRTTAALTLGTEPILPRRPLRLARRGRTTAASRWVRNDFIRRPRDSSSRIGRRPHSRWVRSRFYRRRPFATRSSRTDDGHSRWVRSRFYRRRPSRLARRGLDDGRTHAGYGADFTEDVRRDSLVADWTTAALTLGRSRFYRRRPFATRSSRIGRRPHSRWVRSRFYRRRPFATRSSRIGRRPHSRWVRSRFYRRRPFATRSSRIGRRPHSRWVRSRFYRRRPSATRSSRIGRRPPHAGYGADFTEGVRRDSLVADRTEPASSSGRGRK